MRESYISKQAVIETSHMRSFERDTDRKKVSVLIPCRNEIDAIGNCLENVLNFDAPEGGFEVILIDGMSDDRTREIILKKIEQYPNLILIDNPQKTIPHAMNLGIQKAKGEYIIRTDVRCIHPQNYIRKLIELSEQTMADNVGGVLEAVGNNYIQRSIATAYKSPIAMGKALRDRGDFVGEADTVYGGCFKREKLLEIGMYDEKMIKNEDDELSFRLRKLGGRVFQTGKIRIKYFPRKNYWHLFKQFMQYGYWKVPVIKKHPVQASLRHFLPSALVLGFLIPSMFALFNRYALAGLILYTSSYFAAIGIETLRLGYKTDIRLWPGVLIAIFIIHISYGFGFIINLICNLFNMKPKIFEGLTR